MIFSFQIFQEKLWSLNEKINFVRTHPRGNPSDAIMQLASVFRNGESLSFQAFKQNLSYLIFWWWHLPELVQNNYIFALNEIVSTLSKVLNISLKCDISLPWTSFEFLLISDHPFHCIDNHLYQVQCTCTWYLKVFSSI